MNALIHLATLLSFLSGAYGKRGSSGTIWNAVNFPNPIHQYEKCNMNSISNLCDPDGVLTADERRRLESDLKEFESRTKQPLGSECEKRGIRIVLTVAQNVEGGKKSDLEKISNDLIRKWEVDNECQKGILMLVSVGDKQFRAARTNRVPLMDGDFDQLFKDQKEVFKQARYQEAMSNMIKAAGDKVIAMTKTAPSAPEMPPSFDSSALWTAETYPNPTAGQFDRCNMKATASICDPDDMLSESDRNRLESDLSKLEMRTRQDAAGRSFCEKKGITGAMAIARKIKGGTKKDAENFANDLLQKWKLDDTCHKGMMVIVSIENQKFWIARGKHMPIYDSEFEKMLTDQKSHFKKGEYSHALSNVLRETWELALRKASDNTAPRQTNPTGGHTYSSSGGGGGGGKMPTWLIIVLIIVLIVALIVCCKCLGGSGTSRSGYSGGTNMNTMSSHTYVSNSNTTVINQSDVEAQKHHYAGNDADTGNDNAGTGLYPSDAVESRGGGGGWGDDD